MVKRVLGIQGLDQDRIMVFLKVRVSGLKIKMVILRYDGAWLISKIVTPHHAGLMSIGRLRIGTR